jgi:hypothetical protein
MQVNFDVSTAVKIAEFFEGSGMAIAAIKMWQGICWDTPYDPAPRKKLAHLLYHMRRSSHPMGTVDRSHAILNLIAQSFPTRELSELYFDNLKQLLKARPKRSAPGIIALAVGAGRCGSTSLAAAMAAVPGSCSTHENPPPIDWKPVEEQVRFHFDRLKFLADYNSIVCDASHWWLNTLPRFFSEIPAGKVIGLCREVEPSVQSFMRIKGTGQGSINHWAPPGNNLWSATLFDPTYPSYRLEPSMMSELDAAKASLIRRYVAEYNETLVSLAQAQPDRMLLVRTEEMNDPAAARRISDFLGVQVAIPSVHLNVNNTEDSDNAIYRF